MVIIGCHGGCQHLLSVFIIQNQIYNILLVNHLCWQVINKDGSISRNKSNLLVYQKVNHPVPLKIEKDSMVSRFYRAFKFSVVSVHCTAGLNLQWDLHSLGTTLKGYLCFYGQFFKSTSFGLCIYLLIAETLLFPFFFYGHISQQCKVIPRIRFHCIAMCSVTPAVMTNISMFSLLVICFYEVTFDYWLFFHEVNFLLL